MSLKPVGVQISSADLERLGSMLDEMPETDSPTISGLKKELKRAVVVEPKEVPPNVVSMNSTVRFTTQPSGKRFSLRLVYPEDAREHLSDFVSITSPIGAALLGLAVGDVMDWPLAGGHTTQVKVIEVVSQPEREGRYHL